MVHYLSGYPNGDQLIEHKGLVSHVIYMKSQFGTDLSYVWRFGSYVSQASLFTELIYIQETEEPVIQKQVLSI